jgi:hypothetical protein
MFVSLPGVVEAHPLGKDTSSHHSVGRGFIEDDVRASVIEEHA